jgi:glycerate kinase
VVKRDLGVDVAKVRGAGAAGGLGAGLMAFAGADLVPGAEMVLNALHFTSRVQGADLVITAEGQLDAQTAYGKSVAAVARAAHLAGARLIALVGRIALSDVELASVGIDGALPLADGPITLADSMQRAAILIEDAAARALRLVVLGQGLGTER